MQAPTRLTRIAIVDENKCQPSKCNQECKTWCPVVRTGKQCVVVSKSSKNSFISESLCIGCGICAKKCPFGAISIINLPKELDINTTHRYHANSFKLHRLPQPRAGMILGLVGGNGTGKSTALKILRGTIKPNLGNFQDPPSWEAIIQNFRGSSLQHYFKHLAEGKLKTAMKPQNIDLLPRLLSPNENKPIGDILKSNDERHVIDQVARDLDLSGILDRDISHLSGGELQRFAIAMTLIRDVDVYIFDEPSSFLDIQQRIKAAKLIRSLIELPEKYVIVVEHDLSILDFTSDQVCVLYGTPAVYGVVTHPHGVYEGINIFLNGFIASENLRFRTEQITFKTSVEELGEIKRVCNYKYPTMIKQLGEFQLKVEAGDFSDSEIIVLCGQNGTGKTTFIKLLAGKLAPDGESKLPTLKVSYKPQHIAFKKDWTVRKLLESVIPSALIDPVFVSDVLKPLGLGVLMDLSLQNISGGEEQRVAIVLCLGIAADLYLIDEPSAGLDVEQRLAAAKAIKRYVMHTKKTAFIVEHDFIMATYLADRVIVYDGVPGMHAVASAPMPMVEGMNLFLSKLDVTIRRDPRNFRPRINKLNGVQDREQKKKGEYFSLDL